MTKEQEQFIKQLKYYRKRKNYSQQTLAELCNVSNGTIGNIESGITKPSFDLIIEIANKLEITPDKLFSYDSLPNNFFTDKQIDFIASNLKQTFDIELPKVMDIFFKNLETKKY